MFSRDGRELFYAEQSGRIMAVRTFDVTPDGKRFLMVKEAAEAQAGSSDINIVVNWVEELRQRLPAN